jgi:AraC-like DNA-binding protein
MLAREVRRRPGNAGAGDRKLLERLHSTTPAQDFAGSIRQVAGTLLREGTPQIETVAEIAGMPVRSLQRRLRAEGHSYSELVEQARYLAARDLLRDAGIKITEIALDVGYSDAAHFNRAFRRWAGTTPREFRRQQLAA